MGVIMDFAESPATIDTPHWSFATMTSPNPMGLKAYLVETLAAEPQEVDRWVEEGQLRLFAGTLDYLTYTTRNRSIEHKVADIKRELSPLLEQAEDKADTWWSKVQPWVTVSDYFSPGEARHTYRLAPGIKVENIPAEPLVGKPKFAGTDDSSGSAARPSASQNLPQWVQWLWAKEDAPLPGTTPPDGLVALVETLPEEIIEAAMNRLMTGVSEALTIPRLTPKAKDQWLELLTKAHQRRQGCLVPEYTEATARRTPKLLAQLLDALQEQAGIPALLSKAGALTSTDPRWRQDFAAGLWDAFKGNAATAETLLKRLASSLDDKRQVALWGDLLTAAFAGAYYPSRFSDLNRVMSWLKADLRATAIQCLILQAALHDRVAEGDVASFVAESRYAGKSDGPEKLNALVMAGLLLSEGQETINAEATQAYIAAIGQDEGKDLNPFIAFLLEATHNQIADVRELADNALKDEVRTRERQEVKYRTTLAEKDKRIATLEADRASNRELSRLEIREDMLLRIGGIMQRISYLQRIGENPEIQLRELMERLPRVLHDGGAQLLGATGEVVAFNPAHHHSREEIHSGTRVKVSAPGVIATGGSFGDKVILKANVTVETEE